MSSSLASAKRRRAGIQSSQQPTPAAVAPVAPATSAPPPPPPPANGRMSLPQLLNNIDSRLKAVEAAKPETETETPFSFTVTDPETGTERKMSLSDYMTDMDKKFFMLAEEITTMKDIVVKLQSFTMEVNKTLMEERVRILSDVPENIKITKDEVEEVEDGKDINASEM
jgi:hypothetical protein